MVYGGAAAAESDSVVVAVAVECADEMQASLYAGSTRVLYGDRESDGSDVAQQWERLHEMRLVKMGGRLSEQIERVGLVTMG